jgi:4-hydroxy-tetrahydrodipicolinate synthase
MRKINWVGVYPAVLTFFDSDENLDIEGYLGNLRFQVKSGVQGVIIGGSLGESSTLTHDERIQLLDATVTEIGHESDVIFNIAEGSTRTAIALAKRAEKHGAHGLMVLPPMMYKPTDQEVVDYFAAIAESTNLPILLYNNPVDYKIEIKIEMLDQLQKYPTIQAIKESTRDISNVSRMRNAFGTRYKILCGVDTLSAEELLMGADGLVAGLVDAFPEETVAIYRLIKAGRVEEALKIYRWFLPLLELDIHPQLVQNIKLAGVHAGVCTEYVRAPRKPLVGADRARVEQIITSSLATRPTLPEYLHLPI